MILFARSRNSEYHIVSRFAWSKGKTFRPTQSIEPMNQLQVWAPNAQSVELVKADKQSFVPAVTLIPTTVTYRGATMSGYWQPRREPRCYRMVTATGSRLCSKTVRRITG